MVSLKKFMGKFVECISQSAYEDETANEKKEQSLTKSQRRKLKKKEKKKQQQQQQNADVINNQEKAKAEGPVIKQGETYSEYENTNETHFTRSEPRERYDSTRSEESEYVSGRDGGWYYSSVIPPNPEYYEEQRRRCGSEPANIYRQTGPPDFGQTRKWSSVPASINVTGVSGGSVDTSYASGIANGHQGNVVVQVHPLDGHSGSGHLGKTENNANNHLKTSTNPDESGDQKTLTRSMFISNYQNVIESSLDTLAKLLILFVVLPTFGYLAIHEWCKDSPQLIIGILLTTIIIARYIGGSKPTQSL